jgi:DNA polymerase III sliding clamp (beta) subunit (PCNA family)
MMEEKSYVINIKVLVALQHLAARKDIRRYLNGVHVKFEPDKTVYQATNGNVLGRYTDKQPNDRTGEYIIPIEIVSQLKALKRAVLGKLTINEAIDEANNARIVNPSEHQDFGFSCINAIYPDTDRAIPAQTSNTPANYDVELLVKLMRANKALGAKMPGVFILQQNGNDAAPVEFPVDPAFSGAIMPYRI